MGENLIALNRKGAECYGVDISSYMLGYAQRNIAQHAIEPDSIFLFEDDMRNLAQCFPGHSFNLGLSAYSLEYLSNVNNMREVLAAVYNRLVPDGIFVFCFSHPLQHARHCDLRNASAHSTESAESQLIYSFHDVMLCLNDVGFSIERIVEQQTKSPSQIIDEEAERFPYKFHKGKNPCKPEYDEFSNSAPHTVIYKVRKHSQKNHNSQAEIGYKLGVRELWGETRNISDSFIIDSISPALTIEKFDEPFDDVIGCCSVLDIIVEDSHINSKLSTEIMAFRENMVSDIKIQNASLLGIIHNAISNQNLRPLYYESSISNEKMVFIQRLEPVWGGVGECFSWVRVGTVDFHQWNGARQWESQLAKFYSINW